MGQKQKKYTPEFKQKAVELYAQQSPTMYAEVAQGLGIDPSTLRKWVHLADGAGGEQSGGAANPFEAQEELRRLRKENARLRRDNEILLKASAFFASRSL